jgi:hypothetical protein
LIFAVEKFGRSPVHAKAGYGPYYQIKVEGKENDPLSRLDYGQKLDVQIERVGKITEVRLVKENGKLKS